MPACVASSDYIELDSESGHPLPVAALSVSQKVSVEMARDWSIEMDRLGSMQHRPSASQSAKYAELGINWQAWGENVAWARGFPAASAATLFFEGWRESDTGHYCNLVSSLWTHIGVGHFRSDDGEDWGTQNFYATR